MRRPCPTCPWRRSTPKHGFAGGIIDAKGLLQMVRGGPAGHVMQCHDTPDDRPRVCVGFGLVVGGECVAYRYACALGVADHGELETDEELHTLQSLLKMHGGVVDRSTP